MHRKITRLAFGAKWSGFTMPRAPAERTGRRGAAEHARLQQAGQRDRAQAKRGRPRKVRRTSRSVLEKFGFM